MALCTVDSAKEAQAYYNQETKVISLSSSGVAAEQPLTFKTIRTLKPDAIQISASDSSAVISYLKRISEEAKIEHEGLSGFFKQLQQRLSNLIVAVWHQHSLLWATNAKVISKFAKNLQKNDMNDPSLTRDAAAETEIDRTVGDSENQKEPNEKTAGMQSKPDEAGSPLEQENRPDRQNEIKETKTKQNEEQAALTNATKNDQKTDVENRVNTIFKNNSPESAAVSTSEKTEEHPLLQNATVFTSTLSTLTKVKDYFNSTALSSSTAAEVPPQGLQQTTSTIVNEEKAFSLLEENEVQESEVQETDLLTPIKAIGAALTNTVSALFYTSTETADIKEEKKEIEENDDKEKQEFHLRKENELQENEVQEIEVQESEVQESEVQENEVQETDLLTPVKTIGAALINTVSAFFYTSAETNSLPASKDEEIEERDDDLIYEDAVDSLEPSFSDHQIETNKAEELQAQKLEDDEAEEIEEEEEFYDALENFDALDSEPKQIVSELLPELKEVQLEDEAEEVEEEKENEEFCDSLENLDDDLDSKAEQNESDLLPDLKSKEAQPNKAEEAHNAIKEEADDNKIESSDKTETEDASKVKTQSYFWWLLGY